MFICVCHRHLSTTPGIHTHTQLQEIQQNLENKQEELKKEITDTALVKEAQELDAKRELDAKMDKKIVELDAKIDKKVSDLDIKTDLSINGVFDVVDNDLQPKIAGLQTDKESMQKQLQDALVKVDAVAKQTAECRNIADKNVQDLELSKTLLQNMQAELKKEITCVADACTEALGTTIRAEVSMPVLMCARFCVSLFVHVYLCVSPSLIHNPGHTHTHADTGDSTKFREQAD
jgi:capsule polysaccharide export protein KpsE/RkpR